MTDWDAGCWKVRGFFGSQKSGSRGLQGIDLVAGGITWNTLNGFLSRAAGTVAGLPGRSGLQPQNESIPVLEHGLKMTQNRPRSSLDLPGPKHDPREGGTGFSLPSIDTYGMSLGYIGDNSLLVLHTQSE